MYIFQKSGNIKNMSNIANAGVRKKVWLGLREYLTCFRKALQIRYQPKAFADFGQRH